MNSAYAPVYRLVAGIVSVRGDGPETIEALLQARQPGQPVPVTTVSILPPGNSQVWIKNTDRSGIAAGGAGVEVAFTDLREPFEIQYPEPFSG
jgi:hypothetical protein